jgi:hypothetical protein
VAAFTVYSGHYHKAQTLGTVTYVGNPYSLNFGEASHDPKGYMVVMTDGTFIREPLPMRKHVIINCAYVAAGRWGTIGVCPKVEPGDLVWVKLHGTADELQNLDKKEIGRQLSLGDDFKLDKFPDDRKGLDAKQESLPDLSGEQILDLLIDNLDGHNVTKKKELKKLWRSSL